MHDPNKRLSEDDIQRMMASFRAASRQEPEYALRVVGLARLLAEKRQPWRAFEIARQAVSLAPGDPRVRIESRHILSWLLPRYHVAMMNDARRNAAWDRALRRAIRSGMTVLEIGTGAGMLAMMAARAGAAKVITCEWNPVVAAVAREVVAHNGLADRIEVISKKSFDLKIGVDLETPADLLFCDIFSDDFFEFDPLTALSDAQRRLLVPGSAVIPAWGAIHLALAHSEYYARKGHIDMAAGFDLHAFSDFVPAVQVFEIGDKNVRLVSAPQEVFRFDLAAQNHSSNDEVEVACEALEDSEGNGIARWIRLELDSETVLDTRPQPGMVSFSAPQFCPAEKPFQLRRGERVRVGAAYGARMLCCWISRPTETV